MASNGWDNATLKKLKAFAEKGISTSEIGKKLGISKNAVVGKLNRMGWNAKASAAPQGKGQKAKTKEQKPAQSAAAKKSSAKIVAKPAPKAKLAPVAKGKTAGKSVPAKPAGKVVPAKVAPAPKPVPKSLEAKTSTKSLQMHQRIIQHSLAMANLRPDQCRWPTGDPDKENFHFCGATVFAGKPYCYEHCKQAYQFNPPKGKK
jgi:GcrA cell cycle regulator